MKLIHENLMGVGGLSHYHKARGIAVQTVDRPKDKVFALFLIILGEMIGKSVVKMPQRGVDRGISALVYDYEIFVLIYDI